MIHVLPARLHGEKTVTHGHVELLLLKNIQGDQWEVLAKPAKRLKMGSHISFWRWPLKSYHQRRIGSWRTHCGIFLRGYFSGSFRKPWRDALPPYIHEKLEDRDRYQTVYAKENGSAVAPNSWPPFYRRAKQNRSQRR